MKSVCSYDIIAVNWSLKADLIEARGFQKFVTIKNKWFVISHELNEFLVCNNVS